MRWVAGAAVDPGGHCPRSQYRLTQRCLLALSQVNITLLDINDNYPTWKDEPYFINLVEMTPPNSDVTTVRVREGGCCARILLPFTRRGWHPLGWEQGVTSEPVLPPKQCHHQSSTILQKSI